tara:strand:- start:466 stop:1479 length:1014 start_codon:yes stop_codon:yes gene_type:complete
MAVVSANTSQSYNIGDKRVYSSASDESKIDLRDVITMISPDDTPYQANIGSEDCQNTIFEWLEDSLAATSTTADLEADTTTRAAISHATRQSNICQINSRNASVSGTAQAISMHGKPEGDMAYQITKRTKELKRSVEAVLLSNQARNNGASGTARTTASLLSWLHTNTSFSTSGTTNGADPVTPGGTGSNGVRTDASTDGLRALSSDLINDVMTSAFQNGGLPDMLMVGPVNKVKIASITGRSSARDVIEPNVAGLGSITVFATPFGDLNVHCNLFQRERDALLIEKQYHKVRFLRNYESTELGIVGDENTRSVRAEYGLEVTAEASSGAVFDLTTT